MTALITLSEIRDLINAPDHTNSQIEEYITAADRLITEKAGQHYSVDADNNPNTITEERLNPGYIFPLRRIATSIVKIRTNTDYSLINDTASEVDISKYYLSNGCHIIPPKKLTGLWSVDYVPENDNDLRKWVTSQIIQAMINSEPGIAATDIDRRRVGYTIFHYSAIGSEANIAISQLLTMLIKTSRIG